MPVFGHRADPLRYLLPMGDSTTESPWMGVEFEVELTAFGPEDRVHDDDRTESELDTRNGVATQLVRRLGSDFIICKRDGSLDFGIELVSTPAPIEVHMERWPRLWTPEWPSTVEVRSTCGLHVHVDRRKLTDQEVGKLGVFLTREGSRSLVVGVAGRESPDYAALHRKSLDWQSDVNEHHDALNVTNARTVEFRIFAAPHDWPRMLVDLQFVHSTVAWVRTISSARTYRSAYLSWLRGLPVEQYQELRAFLRDRGLDRIVRRYAQRGDTDE